MTVRLLIAASLLVFQTAMIASPLPLGQHTGRPEHASQAMHTHAQTAEPADRSTADNATPSEHSAPYAGCCCWSAGALCAAFLPSVIMTAPLSTPAVPATRTGRRLQAIPTAVPSQPPRADIEGR